MMAVDSRPKRFNGGSPLSFIHWADCLLILSLNWPSPRHLNVWVGPIIFILWMVGPTYFLIVGEWPVMLAPSSAGKTFEIGRIEISEIHYNFIIWIVWFDIIVFCFHWSDVPMVQSHKMVGPALKSDIGPRCHYNFCDRVLAPYPLQFLWGCT